MTGIDRMRAIAGAWDEWGLGGALAEIADEMERELREERDRWDSELCEAQMDKSRVTAVYLEMNKHCLGHEGMEDSPVARWARELRDALKSYTSDERGAQKPSWHDSAETADVTSDAQKVTRDPAEDVSMSAYDLLPQEDRDALAWVRDHGGIEGLSRLFQDADNRRVELCAALSIDLDKGWSDAMAAMRLRLMPEGCEWPRYESGEPVGFGDEVSRLGEVFSISLYCDGSFALNFRAYSKGERVKRPSVIAADGEPLEAGQTVWDENGDELVIGAIEDGGHTVTCRYADVGDGIPVHGMWSPSDLTHQRPDTWQRIEDDAGCTATKYNERRGTIFTTKQQVARDLVRRCRALAERERGE